ncbi:MAG: hypothetical protein ACOC4E_01470 [Patescibacteria group bacterium]
MSLPAYITLEKAVGETPLQCVEAYRGQHPELKDVPLAYAGRLDPMASGRLLVLIGDTCKRQTDFHTLDKRYEFSILFGVSSDTYDVLGRLQSHPSVPPITQTRLLPLLHDLIGPSRLPYPPFSAKTVQGKPLHTWTLEGRLNEIELPLQHGTIYALSLTALSAVTRQSAAALALQKIDRLPPVTETSKALGRDFRRSDVRADWNAIAADTNVPNSLCVAHLACIASSGTYMRSLAHHIAHQLGTGGLAWHIHRTHIGTYDPTTQQWVKEW